MPLRFHWRLPQGGERPVASRVFQASLPETGLPDLETQINFCRTAEECGIDSVLTAFGWAMPDSILLSAAVGMVTTKIKFIIAYRSGLICPTTFVHQLNTLSTLINGRFSINVVEGHSPQEQAFFGDFLSHDERYDRTEEFLAVCHAFWRRDGDVSFNGKYYRVEGGKLNTPFISDDRTWPELYIAGNSPPAKRLTLSQGSCWMRIAEAPEKVRAEIQPVLNEGKEVGLRLAVIARPTREEAVRTAYSLIEGTDSGFNDKQKEGDFVRKSDSASINTTYRLAKEEWLTPWLWTGAVRTHGAPAIAMVGTPEEIASAVMEYKNIGISQFIISGWPKLEEMIYFGKEVLPLIRKKEAEAISAASAEPTYAAGSIQFSRV